MSTFGKILAFFNVIFAILLLFLAGMDYAERRSGAYAALLHDLWLTGLPVDADEIIPQRPTNRCPLAWRRASSPGTSKKPRAARNSAGRTLRR